MKPALSRLSLSGTSLVRGKHRTLAFQTFITRMVKHIGEREVDGWMDGLLFNQWIDHNSIVGER